MTIELKVIILNLLLFVDEELPHVTACLVDAEGAAQAQLTATPLSARLQVAAHDICHSLQKKKINNNLGG